MEEQVFKISSLIFYFTKSYDINLYSFEEFYFLNTKLKWSYNKVKSIKETVDTEVNFTYSVIYYKVLGYCGR